MVLKSLITHAHSWTQSLPYSITNSGIAIYKSVYLFFLGFLEFHTKCFCHIYPPKPLFPLDFIFHQGQFVMSKYSGTCGLPLQPSWPIKVHSLTKNWLFPSSLEFPITPWLGVETCAQLTSPCWNFVWLEITQIFAWCHNHCEYICTASVLCFQRL